MTTPIRPIADDYGLHPDINRGILQCVEEGLVAGVSVVACGEAATDEQLALLAGAAKQHPQLSVGIHLMLTEGCALTGASTLTNPDGTFALHVTRIVGSALLGRFRRSDLMREWEAQIRHLTDAGISVGHLDSHQHVHLLPSLWSVARSLAQLHRIKRVRSGYQSVRDAVAGGSLLAIVFQLVAMVRFHQLRKPEKTLGVLCSTDFSVERIMDPLSREVGRGQAVEVMVHPGTETDSLTKRFGSWDAHWNREIEELRILHPLAESLSSHRDNHARTMARFRALPRSTRWFVRGRSDLCPFWLIDGLLPREGRLVDVGCGHGYLSLYARESSGKRSVVGVDTSEQKIASARRTGEVEGVEFRTGTVDEALGEQEAFDGAVVIDVLYQLPYADQEKILRSIANRLNMGGVLVLKETHRYTGLRYLLAYLEECLVVSMLAKTVAMRFYYRSAGSWQTCLEQIGFKIERYFRTPRERINNRSFIVQCRKVAPPETPSSQLYPPGYQGV